NNYTEILANFGVLGIVLFYSIYLVLFVRALSGITKGSQAAWVIMAALISVALMDLARVSYSSRTTWLFIAIFAYYSSLNSVSSSRRALTRSHLSDQPPVRVPSLSTDRS